jgi:hypothetical protein
VYQDIAAKYVRFRVLSNPKPNELALAEMME